MNIDHSDPEVQDRIEREPKREHWELVEEKANELLSDPTEISEILWRAGVLQDIGDWAKSGDMDHAWKVPQLIMAAAREYAEECL